MTQSPQQSTVPPIEAQRSMRARSTRQAREAAKLGMTVCLGALVLTGLSRSRSARRWHLVAGAGLIGFSAWHHLLYPSRNG